MTVGEKLRQARVRSGLDLDTLARETRISRRYLDAIEADNTAGIPGQFFYRSFVRQYAEALGLDPSEVGQELEAQAPPPPPPVTDHAPLPVMKPIRMTAPRARFGNRATTTWVSVLAFVAVVAGCSALYAWYHNRQTTPAVTAESVHQPAPTPVSHDVPAPPPAETQQAPPATATETPAAQPAATAPENAAPPSTPSPAPAPDEKVYVAVSSKERAWISLVSDGKQVFAGVLQPGEVKTVGGKELARLKVGNAGGIEVTYNGRPIGAVGPRGQVRTVVFRPDGFEIVKPAVQLEEDEHPGT
jgi:cytoskeleton protein RodZ